MQQRFGEYLKAQRQMRHIDLEEMSQSIRVSIEKLQALEAGDFSMLPKMPFVHGIVKSYGRFIGCDVDELNQKMHELAPSLVPSSPLEKLGQPNDPKLVGVEKPSFYLTQKLLIAVGAVIVLIVGVWFALDKVGPALSSYINKMDSKPQKSSLQSEPSSEKISRVPATPDGQDVKTKGADQPQTESKVLDPSARLLKLSSAVPNVVKFIPQDSKLKGVSAQRIFLDGGEVSVHLVGVTYTMWALHPDDLTVTSENGEKNRLVWENNSTQLNLNP